MNHIAFDHINLTVRNFEESVDWYGRVFGFELVERGTDDEGPWGVIRSGSSMLCIYERRCRKSADEDSNKDHFHRLNHFGIRVEDRPAWEATIEREAIHPHYGGAIRYPHSTSWYVSDPTGHAIEVSSWDSGEVRFG